MVISPLLPGFHTVIHGNAIESKDQLHIVNDYQLNILKKALKGKYEPQDENEALALANLSSRGLLSSKSRSSSKYPKSLSIWLHVTDQCPLRCTYCHVEKRDEHLHDPTLQAFGDMLERTVIAKGLREVTLRLAGGEPVIRFAAIKGWLEATKTRLESHGCKLRVAMLSGLATLPTQVVEFVKKGNGISVSMDGLKEVQDRVRPLVNGEGSFDKVRKNIEKLKKEGISPYVLVVVSNDNVEGLVDFTKWLITENLGFRYSFQKGGEFDREKAAQKLRECYDVIEKAVLGAGYKKFAHHRLADLSTFSSQKAACGAGRNTCSVYLDGSIYLCQMEHGNQVPLGYVSETNRDLCEILVDRKIRKNFHSPSAHCESCELMEHCAGGCPIDTKEAGGHNPNCSLFQEFLPRIHRIHGLLKLQELIGNDHVLKLAA